MRMAKKKITLDKFALASALIDCYYYGIADKDAMDRLKKSKHLTASGKVSKLGEEFISKYYARGSNRDILMRELG